MKAAWGMVGATIALTVVAQLLIKWRVSSIAPPERNPVDQATFVFRMFTDPFVFAALAMAAGAAAAWFLAMTRLPLSLAYPFMALTFPLVVLGSASLFQEAVSPLQIGGVALVVGGVALVGLGAR
jgi:drug/metabolite transporter (DMT)-like permease